MRWPIFQLGCARACLGVILAKFDRGVLRNGPPEAVRIRRFTSLGFARAEALVDGVVFGVHWEEFDSVAVDRGHHDFAGGDQNFFIG